jgi:hypothetical protein
MNKKALVEFVRVSILGSEAVSDNQKTAHFKRVEQGVGYAFDTLLAQIPMDESGVSQIEEYYVKHYYNQSVKEATNGYRYVGVDDSIVPVGEGKGIWYVQPSGGGNPFSQARRPSLAMFRNLKIGSAINETYWRLGNVATNLQIVLEHIGDSPFRDIRRVDYGVVRAFSSYGETEEVRIPGGRSDLLVNMTRAWFDKNYNDMINNNK